MSDFFGGAFKAGGLMGHQQENRSFLVQGGHQQVGLVLEGHQQGNHPTCFLLVEGGKGPNSRLRRNHRVFFVGLGVPSVYHCNGVGTCLAERILKWSKKSQVGSQVGTRAVVKDGFERRPT